jgi:hypothetical protein
MTAKRGGALKRVSLSDVVPWLTNSNEKISRAR